MLLIASLDNHTPCTHCIASSIKSGSLYNPCCMRAVPHTKVLRNARMETSTSTVTFPSFGLLCLSLKLSLPLCFPLFNHLYIVRLEVSKSCAIRVTVGPLFRSFLNKGLTSDENLIYITGYLCFRPRILRGPLTNWIEGPAVNWPNRLTANNFW